ncbi:MAG: UDP-N-acetylmuramate dehydrogenase [Pseudomonadota bacterium]
MTLSAADLPTVRGKLSFDVLLAPYSWFRVGGPADALFLPADEEDLSDFLAGLDPSIPVSVLGACSNTIVRDGGIEGVVIRLAGGYWGAVDVLNATSVSARAGALDTRIAGTAAKNGTAGLEFLSGVPGAIGGAVRTNAGCYGRELKDVLNRLYAISRRGERVSFQGALVDYGDPQIGFDYRHTDFPNDLIVTEVVLSGDDVDAPQAVLERIEALKARRAEAQPIKEKTGGSTFANPDPPGTEAARSSWKLIDAAGCRGLSVGGAQVSEKHCNFMINTGDATAADLEALGELVRARVLDETGVTLRWEIRRIGRIRTD